MRIASEIGRRMMLRVACAAAALAWITCGAGLGYGATAAANAKQDLAGTWQGTLHAGRDLRTVVKITEDAKSGYKADFYSIDQGAQPLPVDSITLDGTTVTMTLNQIGGKYLGKLSADGSTMAGEWSQGSSSLPLVFTRATPETEWAIPAPPPPVRPMAADADPSFEVATIKPSKPEQRGKGFGFQGHRFMTMNTDMNDLIAFAYGLNVHQIIGAPAWFDSDLYDIEALPDTPGQPSQKQMESMLQKLLASRFNLKFHPETRELSVYAITVAKGGPKLTNSTAAANDPQGFGFGKLGDLYVRNMTMADFSWGMQSAVMNRPVVDQTGLKGRYDFHLNWTPDDSQFPQWRSTGVAIPATNNDLNAPPNLYEAIQQQLGLKISATKAPDKVIVIDHVDHPSPN